ncbi:uncharacterized protein KIAA1257 homolog [Trichosurus vulpecula]|uniref:uncharacterized protein KIAA1257 homolog n=1 Tax=Trichosurus vulpecula TaxID=9337 RepID=UPI00186B25E7|nr:uncharacterized protein KIAA1257 homolog [Trichosurus vulpecula]
MKCVARGRESQEGPRVGPRMDNEGWKFSTHLRRGCGILCRMATKSFQWDSEAKPLQCPGEQFSTVTLYQYDGALQNEGGFQPMRHNLPTQLCMSALEDLEDVDIPQVVPCTFTICLALPGYFEKDRRIPGKRRRRYRTNEEESELSLARRQTIFSTELDVMPLLAGQKTVISHAKEKNTKILDCYLNLTVDVPLMTEKQKQDLNPLIIKIRSLAHLPRGPVPLNQLQDINVILLGALDPQNLREYLEGPPMEVEIHDRDRKEEVYLTAPSLFGEDLADANLTHVSHITYNDVTENPLEAINKKWDPYGIAKVSFGDLLLGQRLMDLFVPIHRCKPNASYTQKDYKGRRKSFGGHDPMDTLQSAPMPMGNYFEYSSLLRLRIELCAPLKLEVRGGEDRAASERFGRMIYIFDSSKVDFLRSLLKGITEINAKALHLESYPPQDVQEALSAFKVKIKMQTNLDQDVITGFHLLDGKIHLFVLEGLAEEGLRRLWERYPNRVPGSEEGKFKVFYNSELTFHERLYTDLDAMLYHIHLCKPLSALVKKSTIFVRGLIPQPSFQALIKLDSICHSHKLKDVIEGDLLPSAEMVKCMSQEFGVPISRSELLTPSPLQRKNFLSASLVRRTPRRPEGKMIRIIPADGKSIFNYSIQTLNSGELAKQKLIAQMDKERGKRFTYSQKYLASLPEPLGLTRQIPKSKFWLTPEGFQVPGYQTSFESNQHPKRPDRNRIEELKESWEENRLFTNILKPVLDRERMNWEQRHLDFDIYKKPPSIIPLLDEKFSIRDEENEAGEVELLAKVPEVPDIRCGVGPGSSDCKNQCCPHGTSWPSWATAVDSSTWGLRGKIPFQAGVGLETKLGEPQALLSPAVKRVGAD